MKEGRDRTILQWLIPLVCAIIVIAIMLLKFSVDIRKDAINTVEKDIKEITEKYALRITNDLQSIQASGETVAQVIGKQPSKKSDIVQQLIKALVDQTHIYEAVYCNEKGIFVDQNGESINFEGTVYDEAIKSLSDVEYVYLPEDGVLGIPAILMMIPVPEDKGNLLLFYSIKRIKNLTRIDKEFDRTAFAVMADKDGNILSYGEAGSSFLKGGNIWTNIDKKYQNAGTQARVAMQNSSTDCVELAANREEKTVAFTPIGINDWNLVIGIDQSYAQLYQSKVWSGFLLRVIPILCVVILCFLFFVIANLIGKKRNADRSKTLQEKADTDLLTGLNNKLATERKIKEYIKDYPQSMAMMFVLDIDNFKKINDTQGHAFGDEVLRTLGKHIGVNFRVTDIIGRTGGDEFTIFLKDLKDDANTLKEAQKLVHFFKNFQVGEYVKYSATASIGAAVFPAHGSDFESLYKAADQALYKAKKRGKNQLAFYDDRDRKE